MSFHEWVVAGYFGVFAIVAPWLPVFPHQRLKAAALAVGVVLMDAGVAAIGSPAVRGWIPHVYLVAGYWMPALLVRSPTERRFEEWLIRCDAMLRPALPAVRGLLADVVELAYLLCYPLVPALFAIVWINGHDVTVERFWTAVLLAGYACYGTLPWLVSQPPRLRPSQNEPRSRVLPIVNASVLERFSHRWNTFPSGHVAVTAAAAAGVAAVSTTAGLVALAVVAAICVGAASGRYHYVIDVLFGLGLAAAAIVVARTV
jgi:membrane-associated phospholipid phosphatase